MPDSFEEQVADDLDVPAEYVEDDENPPEADEKDEESSRCPQCGQYAGIVERRVRKRGVIEVFDCGHRIERG